MHTKIWAFFSRMDSGFMPGLQQQRLRRMVFMLKAESQHKLSSWQAPVRGMYASKPKISTWRKKRIDRQHDALRRAIKFS